MLRLNPIGTILLRFLFLFIASSGNAGPLDTFQNCSECLDPTPLSLCLDPHQSIEQQKASCTIASASFLPTTLEHKVLQIMVSELTLQNGSSDIVFDRLGRYPIIAELLISMGQSQFASGRYDLAMTFHQIAETLYENDPQVRSARSEFLVKIGEIFFTDPVARIDLIDKGLFHDFSDPSLLTLRANALAEIGEIEQAELTWDTAFESSDYPHELKLLKAQTLVRIDQSDLALASLYALADDLMPGSDYEKSRIEMTEKSQAELTDYHISVLSSLNSSRSSVYELIARLELENGNPELALIAVNAWLDLDEDTSYALIQRSNVHAQMNSTRLQLADLSSAIENLLAESTELIGNVAQIAFLSRGVLYVELERIDLAMPDFDRAFFALTVEQPLSVEGLQRFLSQAGFYAEAPNGAYDARVSEALRRCFEAQACDSLLSR